MNETHFIHEFPVVLDGGQARRLAAAFEVGRQAHNALLGEGLRRLQLMRESRDFQAARSMPRGRARTARFRDLQGRFGLRRYDLYYWGSRRITRTWLGTHLDAQVVQVLAGRAYKSVIAFGVGRSGRPRFKGPNQLDSLEGESSRQGIRYSSGMLVWRRRRYRLQIDHDSERVQHAVNSPIQRVRLVRRRIRGRTRYFAQLVCRGLPYSDPDRRPRTGRVGIDPGPRVFGIHSGTLSACVDIAMPLEGVRRAIRRLDRALDRKRRAANPSNYDSKGRGIHGPKRWRRSKSYEETRDKLADLLRVRAAGRKNARGRLANAILSLGNDIRIERNGYFGFQRSFGRSVGSAAPGMFVAHLVRKAANAGAEIHLVPTSTRLSQACHGCRTYSRKPLEQRIHECACGVGPVQRDLYSAFLLTTTKYDPERSCWELDADQANAAWSGARLRLPVASRNVTVAAFCAAAERSQAANGPSLGASPQGTERLAGEALAKQGEAWNVVADEARVQESPDGLEPFGERGVSARRSSIVY